MSIAKLCSSEWLSDKPDLGLHNQLRDVAHLRAVCRTFRDLIDKHEHVIVATMLDAHRGTNIALLAELFPPPRARTADGARRPTLKYVNSLEKRHAASAELAGNLAQRALAPLFDVRAGGSAVSLSRRDRDAGRDKAARAITRRLVPQLYHIEHFLVNARLRFSKALTSLAAEGGGGAPPPPELLAQMYRDVQTRIIAQWPDNILLSTHHAFHFLVNSIRLAISPEPPHNTNDDTVSVMLRCPMPLQRCNEFFAADNPAAASKLRRQFMLDMEGEKVKTQLLTSVLFDDAHQPVKRRGSGMLKSEANWTPRMGEVWFESAKNELRIRGLERHRPDKIHRFAEVQGEVMVGCPDCEVIVTDSRA